MTGSLRRIVGTGGAATAVALAWLTPMAYAGISLNGID
jgi:hypothetical protein